MVLVHGFGEHIGRYESLGRALAASGRSLWAFDLAGFGRSDGPRAVVEKLADALADIGRMVAAAARGPASAEASDDSSTPAGPGTVTPGTVTPGTVTPGTVTPGTVTPGTAHSTKPVLLGHSTGGAFAAAYALDNPTAMSALVLSAPAVHLASRPKWQVIPAEALATAAPRVGLGRIAPAKLSRDPDVVSGFAADPLVWHGSVPARTAVEIYQAGRQVMKRAGELRVPLLVLHGDSDQVVPVSASRDLFAAAGSEDKQLRTFKGLYHEIFQEVGKQEVVAVLLEWLDKH